MSTFEELINNYIETKDILNKSSTIFENFLNEIGEDCRTYTMFTKIETKLINSIIIFAKYKWCDLVIPSIENFIYDCNCGEKVLEIDNGIKHYHIKSIEDLENYLNENY